ncbi:MAG: low molecular weight phosphatase family protein [Planctomycetota bacterium]
MPKLLFLCTGNYYRSRFAEFYFRHLASKRGIAWEVDSRGLELHDTNPGPLSRHTRTECQRRGVSIEPLRDPLPATLDDLRSAELVVAVKEAEHRWRIREQFPGWEDRVEYWAVHDLDAATADEALPRLAALVEAVADRLA